MLKLYQFPISHYCEKARWALDYKNLDYEIQNLLPGLHIKTIKKLSPNSAVPLLVHDQQVIQKSNKIIDYLDDSFVHNLLTPQDPDLKAKALDGESWLDKEVGITTRICCYHVLLDYPEIVIPFFTHHGPWYGKWILKPGFAKLSSKMRQLMNINQQSAQAAKLQLNTAIEILYQHYEQHEFLVGDQFSRADLSAAALIAPLCKPEQYGLDWPASYPQKLEDLIDEFRPRLAWVDRLYRDHR